MTDTFTTRCKLATDSLPMSEYRARLEALHGEMLQHIAKLQGEASVMRAILSDADNTLSTIEPDDTEEAAMLGELRRNIKAALFGDGPSLF